MMDHTDVLRHFKDQYKSLRRLVKEITIDSIAEFELETCRKDDRVREVMDRMTQMEIDQMPVDPKRTHYVVREDLEKIDQETRIHEVPLRALTSDLLLSAGTPMVRAYPLFRERAYLFVLRGNQVEGIVTRGDFQRTPFRIYLFGLLSLLEMGVTRLILNAYGDEDWRQLPGGRKAGREADRWYDQAEQHGEEPRYKFEFVSLATKLDLLRHAERVLGRLNDEKQQLIQTTDPEAVRRLRNNLAHADDLTSGFQAERWGLVFEVVNHLERLTEVITANDRASRAMPYGRGGKGA